MDAAIKASLVAIQAIVEIVQDIKETPNLIQTIDSQLQQLSFTLKILHGKLPSYILSNTEIEGWVEHQTICNKLLRDIEHILEDYARSQTTHPVWGPIKFKFSVKGDLQQHSNELEKCVERFEKYSDIALKKAQQMPSPEFISQQYSKKEDPVVSLAQFAQVRIEAREEAMCGDPGSSQLAASCETLGPNNENLRPS